MLSMEVGQQLQPIRHLILRKQHLIGLLLLVEAVRQLILHPQLLPSINLVLEVLPLKQTHRYVPVAARRLTFLIIPAPFNGNNHPTAVPVGQMLAAEAANSLIFIQHRTLRQQLITGLLFRMELVPFIPHQQLLTLIHSVLEVLQLQQTYRCVPAAAPRLPFRGIPEAQFNGNSQPTAAPDGQTLATEVEKLQTPIRHQILPQQPITGL